MGALIRNTRDDPPMTTSIAPSSESLAHLAMVEAARDAALERVRGVEAEQAALVDASAKRQAAIAQREQALLAERDEAREQLERAERERTTRVEEMKDRLATLTRERDHLRRTIDTELPQGEAKELLVTTLYEKGEEHEKRGNLLDAFHLYRRVLRLAPTHVDALLKVATIYYSAGLLLPAAEALRGVVELVPDRAKVAEQLAVVEEMIRRRGVLASPR